MKEVANIPKIEIHEECMREGMQIESAEISVGDKIRLLNALSKTGLQSINVGSFVSPKYTPQMSSMEEVLEGFEPVADVHYYYLAFNQQGHDRAARFVPPLSPPASVPTLSVHMCDTFVRRNANMSQAQEIGRWEQILQRGKDSGAQDARVSIGAAWGSNFSGIVTEEDRLSMLRRQIGLCERYGLAVSEVLLADPMSWCMPHAVQGTLDAIQREWPNIKRFHLHLHNARGLAFPSIYAALSSLKSSHTLSLDTTAGGIGGCPYCGNGRATGMAATEDVVNLLEAMGVDTGVNLGRLIDFVWMLEDVIGRPCPGFVSQAGPFPSESEWYDPNLPFVETHQEARHFKLGSGVADHQIRPWREPIPAPMREAASSEA